MMRLFLGSVDKIFKGLCLFFIRCNNDTVITEKNIHVELHFSVLDASEGLFSGITDLLSKVFVPAINATDNWGPLNLFSHGDSEKQRFKETIDHCLSYFLGVKTTIDGIVKLNYIESINFTTMQSFEGIRAAASDKAVVAKCEEALMVWCNQIQQALFESELVRKEAGDCGPITELKHWIRMYVKFSFIIEQVKGENFKAVVVVLNMAKSKIIEVWKELDGQITHAANESKDNVKLLHALEQVCKPLYTLDLATVVRGIQKLLNVIQAIYRISGYYQTSEHITSLFVKVANQIVTACKAYITETGRRIIWDQDVESVIVKIQECTFLIQEYQESFHRKQAYSEMHNEKSFDVSESYIFGKLEAFCERTDKIGKIISIVQSYSALSKCTTEGIDRFYIKFQNTYQNIRKRTFNILDMKKTEFDDNFTEFMEQINNLEEQMQGFMRNCIGRVTSPQEAIQVLHRFGKLNIPCLNSEIPNTTKCILQRYMEMLQSTKMLYEHYKEDPPAVKNMPPVSGRILWSRQLLSRITEPITYLKTSSDILSSPDGKAAVQLYNRMVYVLVDFQVLHYDFWLNDFSTELQDALQAKLLVHHSETKQMFVNFDPKFLEIFQETKCMMKLGLDIPEEAEAFLKAEADLNSNYLQLEKLLKTYKTLCSQIHPAFTDLMSGKIRKVESTLHKGLTDLTWSSVALPRFFEDVDADLQIVSQLLNKLLHVMPQQAQVDTHLLNFAASSDHSPDKSETGEISSSAISAAPGDSPASDSESERCSAMSAAIQDLIKAVRDALHVQDDPSSSFQESVSFRRSRRSAVVFPNHADLDALLAKEWRCPDRRLHLTKASDVTYPFSEESVNLWTLPPQVDPQVATTLPLADAASLLDPADKRVDSLAKSVFVAAGAAIRPAFAASWVAKQLIRALPPDSVQGELAVLASQIYQASKFLCDASMESARRSRHAAANSVAIRRTIWLRSWAADSASKKALISLPFLGGKLFGNRLEELISEATGERFQGFYSILFTVPKKNVSLRPILDLKALNLFARVRHFRMESFRSVIASLEADEFLSSIDIQDAYLHVPIALSHQRFLRFAVGSLHFQFVALPFGLASAPRVFTKVLAPLVELLRARGVALVPYLDDLLIRSPSLEDNLCSLRITLSALAQFRWLINHSKSSLIPCRRMPFLGMIFPSPREDCLSSGGGGSSPRPVSLDHQDVWDKSPAGLERRTRLPPEPCQDLSSWLNPRTVSLGRSFLPPCWRVITTDASLSGWGAVFGSLTVYGLWSVQESSLQISVLELRAIFLPLSHWTPRLRGLPIRIQTDNSTAVAYLNHQGGTRSVMALREASRILRWAETHVPVLSAMHIPGVDNWAADFLSRQLVDPGEWSLHPEVFLQLCHRWGTLDVDLFASRLNRRLPCYVSRSRDPQALAVDALFLPWSQFDLLYLFPPIPLLPRVLKRLKAARSWWLRIGPAGRGPSVPPKFTSASFDGVAVETAVLKSRGLSDSVIQTMLHARKPQLARIYYRTWRAYFAWCESGRFRPLRFSVPNILVFLQDGFDKGLRLASLRGQISALSVLFQRPVASRAQVRTFLQGVARRAPPFRFPVETWDLNLVLDALQSSPFEPLAEISLSFVSFKVAFLVAVTSIRRVSELAALSCVHLSGVSSGQVPAFAWFGRLVSPVEDLLAFQFLCQVNCIHRIRIDTVLNDIAETLLMILPDDGPTTVENLLASNEIYTKEMAKYLNHRSEQIEQTVQELICIFESVYEPKPATNTKPLRKKKEARRVAFTDVDEYEAVVEEQAKDEEFSKQCYELYSYFTGQLVDSLQKCTRLSLDFFKRKLFISSAFECRDSFTPPVRCDDPAALLVAQVHLVMDNVVMLPSLDNIQQAINNVIQFVLEVSRSVYQWEQWKLPEGASVQDVTVSRLQNIVSGRKEKVKQDNPTTNFYSCVSESMTIYNLVLLLSTSVNSLRESARDALGGFEKYRTLWMENRESKVKEYVSEKQSLGEIKERISYYDLLEQDVNEINPALHVGFIELNTAPIKVSISTEAKAWKLLLCRYLHQEYKLKMADISEFIAEYLKILSRPILDLDDVQFVMKTLTIIRENEIRIDRSVGPVEEAYATLSRFQVNVTSEETDVVDTLRYYFKKLLYKVESVQDELIRLQPELKSKLTESVGILQKDMVAFDAEYEKEGPLVPGITSQEASARLHIFQIRFDELWRKCISYSSGEQLFGLPVSDYDILHKMRKELGLLQNLYGLYDAVTSSISRYYETLWTDINVEWISAELQDFQEKCNKLPKDLKHWQAFLDLKKRIDDFSEFCLLLDMMRNKTLKKRHWGRIADLIGCKLDVQYDSFCWSNIMEASVLQHKDEIEDICTSAVKEKDIESKLGQVTSIWNNQFLRFSPFKGRGELLIKGAEAAEIIVTIEDNLMVLGTLLNNRYNEPFKQTIQSWIHKLSISSDILEEWLLVQTLWIYLDAVFVSEDIASQLPQEAKRFKNIDKTWVKLMQRARDKGNVIQCCAGDETLIQLLPHLHEQLQICQKSLTGYLERKRLVFPRFFFISDPVLLEILGQANDSHTIQPHLAALSDNINEVEFCATDYDQILTVVSREGEVIKLDRPVKALGPVEVWLGELLCMQQSSLHEVIRSAYQQITDDGFQLLSFLSNFPAQVTLLGLQILWTHDSEEALCTIKEDRKVMQRTNQKFLEILNALMSQTVRILKKYERIKFESLITIHMHQRDVFDGLVKMRIRSAKDFEWVKQSRVYFKDSLDKVLVSIMDVNFEYQNEFLGCAERLVPTQLTNRCYIALAQAIGMTMGGAAAGPAATGKTETVKDMGKALGKYVVIFNCSPQMDCRALGRIVKGLARSGSWGCFDEFSRIELPVLSVASQQIYIMLSAQKIRRKQFTFSDGEIADLNPEFGIFLTMNPKHADFQDLPENLKIQFRMVSMMVPDKQMIMRVKLASAGFLSNASLSRKFYVLYKLCEEQLSEQGHYDFGLRNILSVLRTLGDEKRAKPNESESNIVMRGLQDMNLSMLVDEDKPLFHSLINDLFPGTQVHSSSYTDLQNAVANQVKISGLVNHPPWNLKLIQLYETAQVRHGLMTLGSSGSGKSSLINVLMRAMTECGLPHRGVRMNPKAITASQMFGRLDTATNDWTDGIFSALWRKTLKTKAGENVWLLLDGPVDATWIENLSSVLDDNKTLTLANGDRVPMAPGCKLLFEVDSIENASPSAVSRMGMVFLSSSVLDWRPILKAWLNKRSAEERDIFQAFYDKVFEDAYTYMHLNLHPKMRLQECNYIMQSILLLEGCIPTVTGCSVPDPGHLHRLFVFALMWSLGALLELDSRERLEAFLRSHEYKLDLPEADPGACQTMFEFLVNENGDWEHWNKRVSQYSYPRHFIPEYASIMVPDIDNVRTQFLIDTIAKQQKGVLLTGEQGTGKTVMVNAYLKRYNIEEHVWKSLNFSAATEPLMFQRAMESFVDKRIGSTHGPSGGRKMTVFIDDINTTAFNDWGNQVTNEIVRQMMEMKGMYSLDKPGDFTAIVDVQFIGAMIHPGGGCNDIPQRLKRQFTIFNCTLPSSASIDKIFGVIGCGYFHSCRNFRADVCSLVKKLVPASRALWKMTKMKMLPTPSKFHYTFSLRDLSRIWQGMLTIKAEECTSVSTLLALFRHECQRVIADRFVCHEDHSWFDKSLAQVIAENVDPQLVSEVQNDFYFVDFLRDVPERSGEEPEDIVHEAPKLYEMVASFEFLCEKLRHFQKQLNDTGIGSPIELVLFRDAVIHLIKISRIIRTARGNALLIGDTGSGKQSLSRLASFIAGYKIFQIVRTRSYGVSNLLEDLKVLYRMAGVEGKGVTFILTDNDIREEFFLEYMNNILSSGEVSNLFSREELEEIAQPLLPVMKRDFPRHPPTFENLYEYFLSRCRRNLHVVLCLSPVGNKLRTRSLKFPALITGCTMDWFSHWPRQALVAVSSYFLSGLDIACSSEGKSNVMEAMAVFHDQMSENCESYFHRFRRRAHVTSKSYLSFIHSYKKIYAEKCKSMNEQAELTNKGLSKLMEASESMGNVSKELAEKENELALASLMADKVLAEVTLTAQAAAKVQNEMQLVKDKAQSIAQQIESEKRMAESKLEAARPALLDADAALNTIKPVDISTVRKLAKPPHLVMRIMDACLLLLQKRLDPVVMDPDKPCCRPSWGESVKLMSTSGFLQSLHQFPKDCITEEIVELLQPYFQMEDYTMENARKLGGNVSGLMSWTQAMVTFYEVNKEVLPLKESLMKRHHHLEVANCEMTNVQQQLDEKRAELDVAQSKFDGAMLQKMNLLSEAELCRKKVETASDLLDGLSGERIRWTEQSRALKSQSNRLAGDVLIVSAFLSYCGPFNQIFRNLLLKDIWEKELQRRRIPFSENPSIVSMLADEPMVSEWILQGLPEDDFSIQNGLIITKSTRYPLLIDPQSQGKTWIKNKEKINELQVTCLNHKYFRTHLEDCLSLGRPLLIEDIGEDLDPSLDNVLEKNFIKSGNSFKVKVGEKEVDVMDKFRLYITTKLPNPVFTPEINAKAALIDFTVTMKGLEKELLSRVTLAEKQELEADRIKLMQEVNVNRHKMKELEDNLLYRLSATTGFLVEDKSLLEVLRITKQIVCEVREKLHVTIDAEAKISKAQEQYRPVATRGSVLYFLTIEMSSVNIMYQMSLHQFLKLFDRSLSRSEKSPLIQKRLSNITEYLTYEVFRYYSRGLYERHKFLFALLLTLRVDLQQGKIKHKEFQVLLQGGAALDLKSCPTKPFKWILDMTWTNLVELSRLPHFSEIITQVTRNEKGWKIWFDRDTPEEEIIPEGYNNSLDSFHRLLLIRSWCPDRTLFQARKYITDSLHVKYTEPDVLNLASTWEESDTRTPLIGLLSVGSDPTNQIYALAKKLKLTCRAVSMGPGQGFQACRLLQMSMQQGGWVLLQNCHLGLECMEKLLDTIESSSAVHETFRVWMTTEPHRQVPVTLLQTSVRFTNEPPQGMRAGLKRTFTGLSQDLLDGNLMWKPLLYTVAFLHSAVQERRKYGPIGWNIPYEFCSADFTASIEFVQNHLDESGIRKGVSCGSVRYMIGEVLYGGHITDEYDKRLLNCFAKVWLDEKIFDPTYGFYTGYEIPRCKTVDQYLNHIQSLPAVDSPQVFGLHPNADITYQSNAAASILEAIAKIQPQESRRGVGESREAIVYRIAEEMLEKLPPDYGPHEARSRLEKTEALSPMNIFLHQEIHRMQKVISIVRSSLSDLKLAIDGTIIMSESLRDVLDDVYSTRVPNVWRKASWASATLGFWFTELLERSRQFTSWIYEGRPNVFWMTGFFNPKGFLTAVRQEAARAHRGWALDSVTVQNVVLKHMKEEIPAPPSDGVYIHGLFLEGAGWDRRSSKLVECTPKVLFTMLPVLHIFAVKSPSVTDPSLYSCPVYKKPERSDHNYVTTVSLKTCQPSDHWVLRGVAILCDNK
ncbi:dynein heavy chain 8, axonemal [Bufo bufo]|uniref:dynein heavy chain 8, axonemal n=1 Tax=Bufo bufo TaxID=8384 RepID=UPI001ABE8A27|nr:dynein heavy chain 8, axonemal [Bufo bufo]